MNWSGACLKLIWDEEEESGDALNEVRRLTIISE